MAGRNLPTRSWRHRWCLVECSVEDETGNFHRCPSPQDWYWECGARPAGRGFSLSVEGHPPDPPAVRRRSIAPERPREIASKQLNAVTPRTRASGPPPQHDSIAQPAVGEPSYHAPPTKADPTSRVGCSRVHFAFSSREGRRADSRIRRRTRRQDEAVRSGISSGQRPI
jgi:hypothetical protein